MGQTYPQAVVELELLEPQAGHRGGSKPCPSVASLTIMLSRLKREIRQFPAPGE